MQSRRHFAGFVFVVSYRGTLSLPDSSVSLSLSCDFFKVRPPPRRYPPVDIEDLVKLGTKSRGCPYFAAKLMAETAELIFCPYNYLLDPAVRSAMDVDVKGALVILDEAHNVEDTAREAASCDIQLLALRAAAAEFTRAASEISGRRASAGACRRPSAGPVGEEEASATPAAAAAAAAVTPGEPPLASQQVGSARGHMLLASAIMRVADWLGGATDLEGPRCPLRAHGFERWMAVWSGGTQVARQMHDMGLHAAALPAVEEARKAATKEANDSKTPFLHRAGGFALKTAEMLLTSARYSKPCTLIN